MNVTSNDYSEPVLQVQYDFVNCSIDEIQDLLKYHLRHQINIIMSNKETTDNEKIDLVIMEIGDVFDRYKNFVNGIYKGVYSECVYSQHLQGS